MLLIVLNNQDFLYRGEDADNVFCNNLSEIIDDVKKECKRIKNGNDG